MIYFVIVAGIILLDQIVKKIVVSNMYVGESIPLLEDFFHITYIHNKGAAFSLWEQQWILLIAFPAIVMVVGLMCLFIKRKTWDKLYLLSIALICGGGLGNLIDRIIQGYVVDMFDFRVFPVFNIADIFICIGCGLMLIYVIFLERKNGDNEQ
jgi:signal peptidase II